MQTTSEGSQTQTNQDPTTEPKGEEQVTNLLEGAGEEGEGDEGEGEGGEQPQDSPEGEESQVPEQYDLKPPEGIKELPEEFIGKFTDAAKQIGLSQDQAQKAFEFYLRSQQEEIAKAEEDMQRQAAEWAEEVRKMWGTSFEEKRAVAAKAYSEIVQEIPEIRDVIEAMGLGTHPAVLKLFYRLGQLTQEDRLVTGKHAAPAKSEEELLATLYPTTANKR